MEEKKMIYQVMINVIDPETNETTEVHNNEYSGLTMLGTLAEDESRMGCTILHENLAGLAAKLASDNKTSMACRMACMMLDEREEKNGNAEAKLMSAILGGMMEE